MARLLTANSRQSQARPHHLYPLEGHEVAAALQDTLNTGPPVPVRSLTPVTRGGRHSTRHRTCYDHMAGAGPDVALNGKGYWRAGVAGRPEAAGEQATTGRAAARSRR